MSDFPHIVTFYSYKLSYHPQLALLETVFVRDHKDEYLSVEYEALVSKIIEMVCLPRLLESLEDGRKMRLLIETIGRMYSSLVMASLLFLAALVVGVGLILGGLISLASMPMVIEYSTLIAATVGFGFPMLGFKLRKLTLFACLLFLSR